MPVPRARHAAHLLALLSVGCVSTAPEPLLQTITPGVQARMPSDMTRQAGVRGIDSDAARFEGRDSAVVFDRGMHAARIQPQMAVVASPVIGSGQTLDRSGLLDGFDYRYAIALVERVTVGDAIHGAPAPPELRLSIGVFCNVAARCEAIADTILTSLSIGERFPSDP
ncbi:MAG: hypothetical protein ABW163_10675 [Luteimonas sp.]